MGKFIWIWKKKIGWIFFSKNKRCLKLPELPRNHISSGGGVRGLGVLPRTDRPPDRRHRRVTCRVAPCEQQGTTKNKSPQRIQLQTGHSPVHFCSSDRHRRRGRGYKSCRSKHTLLRRTLQCTLQPIRSWLQQLFPIPAWFQCVSAWHFSFALWLPKGEWSGGEISLLFYSHCYQFQKTLEWVTLLFYTRLREKPREVDKQVVFLETFRSNVSFALCVRF